MRSALKTFSLALFLAVLGFSYALATHSDSENDAAAPPAPRSASARALGTPLRFTNAYLAKGVDPGYPNGGNSNTDPKGFDLGDATQGVTFTRYLNAAGGGLPYTFATKPNFDVFGSNPNRPIQTPPVPKVFLNGRITDSFGTSLGGAARFNAVVTDFLGTQRTGTFRINVFPALPPTPFRFAQDSLPIAQLGNSFYTKIETLFAPGAVTFSVVSSSVVVNGTAVASLETAGLSLAPDGILFGRPTLSRTANKAATIQFTARASSTTGDAIARNGAGKNQVFVIQVEDNAAANSEVLASSCAIAATLPASGQASLGLDTFTYNGVFDPKGLTVDSLAGSAFTLRINGATLTGAFDAKGAFKSTRGLSVTISPTRSTIQMKIKGADLSSTINAPTAATTPVVMSMEFKHYITCEAFTMKQRARATKHALTYNLGGRKGQSMAGGMQMLSASGVDKKFFDGTKGTAGVDGDAWYIRFVGVPRFGIDSGAAVAFPVRSNSGGTKGTVQTGQVMATITIGEDALPQVTAMINSVRLVFKAKSTDPGIYQLYLDGQRFLHSVQTNSIPPSDTNIPQAINSKAPTILRLGLDITGFSGDTGRVIAPDNFVWRSR